MESLLVDLVSMKYTYLQVLFGYVVWQCGAIISLAQNVSLVNPSTNELYIITCAADI